MPDSLIRRAPMLPRHTVPPVDEPSPPGVPPDLPLPPEEDPVPPPVEPPVMARRRYCFSS